MPDRPTLDPALSEALVELAATETLLIALDFDGTLAPLMDDPLTSEMLPEADAALRALDALPNTLLAFISGRGLEELRAVTRAPDNFLLAGSHGGELHFGPEAGDGVEQFLDQDLLEPLGRVLQEVVDGTRGARLEAKPRGFAVHVRGVADEAAVVTLERARRVVHEFADLTIRPGKDVLEFAITDAHKGEALEQFRAASGATGVLFAGDDVTDEDAMRVLREGDLGVRVGSGPTVAGYRVDDAAGMAVVLEELLAARTAHFA